MNETKLYIELGKNIAARRRALEIKQSELAESIGLSRASVANIERGKQKIHLHQIYRLAAGLELSGIDQLVPIVMSKAQFSKDQRPEINISDSNEKLTLDERKQIEQLFSTTASKPRNRKSK